MVEYVKFTKDYSKMLPEANNLKTTAKVCARAAIAGWGRSIQHILGWAPPDQYGEHCSHGAIDIQCRNYQSASGQVLDDFNQLAKYFQRYADEFRICSILWRQRSWTIGDNVGAWSSMGDRGSATSNHMDHMHVLVQVVSNPCGSPRCKDYNYRWNKFTRPVPPPLADREKIPDGVEIVGKDSQGGKHKSKKNPGGSSVSQNEQQISTIPSGDLQLVTLLAGSLGDIYKIGEFPTPPWKSWNDDGED